MRRFYGLILALCLALAGMPAHAQDAKPRTLDDMANEIRATYRKQEKENGGFEWQPWSLARTGFAKFGADRDPQFATYIGDGKHVDFAVADVDRSGEPDLLVYFWGDCGNRGCAMSIYFDRADKPVSYYSGWTMRPSARGVTVDDADFGL